MKTKMSEELKAKLRLEAEQMFLKVDTGFCPACDTKFISVQDYALDYEYMGDHTHNATREQAVMFLLLLSESEWVSA